MKRDVTKPGLLDRIAGDCIAVRVRLINRVVTAIYDEALRPHGLRVSQANILVAVARKGEARPADICRLLRLEKSTLSRDVEVMKAQGLAGVGPADRGPEPGAPGHPDGPRPPRQVPARLGVGAGRGQAPDRRPRRGRPASRSPTKLGCGTTAD